MSADRGLKDIFIGFLESKFPDALRRGWTVALSGGVDSMVLLHVAKQAADELGVPCRAIHVHHGLREQADADKEFVVSVCRELQVPLQVRFVDVPGVPAHLSKGVEADARQLRYQAIIDSLRDSVPTPDSGTGYLSSSNADCPPGPVVLLAHHADDQTETVLMRLARGTSPRGLAGMRPVRQWSGVFFLRPFLTTSKCRLMSYAKEHRITYVQDETNFDRKYTRNFIRHEIVTKLTRIQPNLNQVVCRLTEVLRDEDDWLDSMAHEAFSKLVRRPRQDVFTLQEDSLLELPLPLQRRLITIILYCLAPSDWTFDHVDSILRICSRSGPSSELHLPYQTVVRKVYDQLQFVRSSWDKEEGYQLVWSLDKEPTCEVTPPGNQQSWLFGRNDWQGKDTQAFRSLGHYEAVFPLVDHITIAPGGRGERMKVFGLHGSKKLQDLFVDAKVPRYLRSEWPCVYLEDELVWIPGVARSGSFLLEPIQQGWRITAQPFHDYCESGDLDMENH